MSLNPTIDLCSRIPLDLLSLLARLGIGVIFLRSGMLKLDGWESGNTLALFQYEYQLPLIPPQLAAPLAMGMELAVPMFLFAGLGTRFAALALLGMTAVIEIFVYPRPSTRMLSGQSRCCSWSNTALASSH